MPFESLNHYFIAIVVAGLAQVMDTCLILLIISQWVQYCQISYEAPVLSLRDREFIQSCTGHWSQLNSIFLTSVTYCLTYWARHRF